MAHFNYYRAGSGTDRCFKLINPKSGEVWDSVGLEMLTPTELTAKSDDSDGFTDIAFDTQLHGYPITLPDGIPSGEYDILFFDVTAAEMEAAMTTAVEEGWGLRWNGRALISPPREILTDLVK